MYKLQYDISSALKTDKKRLQKDSIGASKVKSIMELLVIDPFSLILNIKKLSPKTENKYRLRVGEYRVIYSIDIGNKIILIHRIAQRKYIYR